MRFLTLLLFAGFALLANPGLAQGSPEPAGSLVREPQPDRVIRAELPAGEAEVGERLRMSLRLPPGNRAEELALRDMSGDSASYRLSRASQGAESGDWWVEVRSIRSGEWTVGPFEVTAKLAGGGEKVFYIQPLSLTVLAAGVEAGEPEDFTGLSDTPFPWGRAAIAGAIAAAGLAILAALFVLAFRSLARRRQETAAFVPPTPPIDEAFSHLNDLRQMVVFRNLGTNAHYTELSILLRRYLERQFAVPALEMSEDELRDVISRYMAGSGMANEFLALGDRAGMAKFAKTQFDESIAASDCALVGRWLEVEKQRLAAEAAAAAQKPAKEDAA